uniref:Rab n=1 Tax=Rhipicephalus appendiculatus TaxID=34631 RepID=A0A131Z773_RHIAP
MELLTVRLMASTSVLSLVQECASAFEYDLPAVDGDSKMVEKLTDFWCVNDIYTFENIGFTNTVGQTKYLACADCERGPVGWHSLETRKSFVALSRVRHL